MTDFKTIATIILTLALLDGIWLSLNSSMYGGMFSRIQGSPMRVNLIGMAVAYLFVFLSFVLVVVPRLGSSEGTLWDCVREAGVVGLCIYGVYNGTNLTTFKDYSWVVAVIDTLWGGVLYTAVAWVITLTKKKKI